MVSRGPSSLNLNDMNSFLFQPIYFYNCMDYFGAQGLDGELWEKVSFTSSVIAYISFCNKAVGSQRREQESEKPSTSRNKFHAFLFEHQPPLRFLACFYGNQCWMDAKGPERDL